MELSRNFGAPSPTPAPAPMSHSDNPPASSNGAYPEIQAFEEMRRLARITDWTNPEFDPDAAEAFGMMRNRLLRAGKITPEQARL